MIDVIEAARRFVFLSYGKNKYSLTLPKLQYLLYLTQGWSFVWDGVPAFSEEFEAGARGPVSGRVVEVFGKYGRDEIPETEGSDDVSDEAIGETIDAVWREFGRKPAFALSEMVCGQDPWLRAHEQRLPISVDDVRKYFLSVYGTCSALNGND